MISLLDLEATKLEFFQLPISTLAVRKTEKTVSGLRRIGKQAPGILSVVNIYYDHHLEDRQDQYQRACISVSSTLLN